MTEQQINQELEEFDNQIIPEYGLSRNQLKAYFEKVENKDNWKYPIDMIIEAEDKENVKKAIVFFTGSEPTFSATKDDTLLHVEAEGYYNAIGA